MGNNAKKYSKYDEVDERILALFAENKEKAFRLLYDTYIKNQSSSFLLYYQGSIVGL